MAPRHWSRSQIEEFVSGQTVYLRDEATGTVAPPPWLAAAADRVGRETSQERIVAIHPEDWATYTGAFEALVQDARRELDVEYRVDAGDVWVWERCRAVNLIDHVEVGAIVCTITVTGVAGPRDAVDKPLLHEALEAAPHFVAYLDATGVTRDVKGDVEVILGVPADELLDRYLIEWMHPDFHRGALAMILELRTTHGNIAHTPLCFFRPGGELVWLEASAVNLLGPYNDGDIVVTFIDLSPRVRATEAALATEDALIAAADAMTTAFYRTDDQGRFVLTNHLWPDLFAGADEVDDLVALFHPDSQAAVAATLAAADADVEGRTYPLEGLAADGETVLALTCRAIGIPGEVGRGYVGTALDVTDDVFVATRREGDEVFETSGDDAGSISPGAAAT